MIKKIKRKIYSIFKSDSYPTLRLIDIFSIRVQRTYPSIFGELKENSFIKLLDKSRLIFWTFLAKSHKGFECCYRKNYSKTNNKYLNEIKKNGFVVIENFIPEKEYIKLLKNCLEIKKNLLKDEKPSKKQLKNLGYKNLEYSSYEIICKNLNYFTKEFFHEETKPKIFANLQVCRDFNGMQDKDDGTTLWHADRFIPSLNAQYYPLGSDDWMPTERIVKSPYIGGIKEIEKLQYHYKNLKDYSNENFKIYKSICKPNTLVLAFHHILHRKAKITRVGERFMIFITHYNCFTKKSLFKSFFKFN